MARRPAKSVLHRCFALVAAAWALLCAQLNRERDSWFAWMVVAFGAGIALYYSLKAEPAFWLVPTSALLCAALLPLLRRLQGARFALAAIAAAVLAGFCLAAFNSRATATRTLPISLKNVTIEGVVLSRTLLHGASAEKGKDAPRHIRYALAPLAIEGIPPDAMPQRLFLSPHRFGWVAAPIVAPGDFVHLFVEFEPFPDSEERGADVPARRLRFAGIGAVGFFHDLTIMDAPSHSLPWRQRAGIAAENLRLDVLARIRKHLSADAAGIAAALIVGERGLLAKRSLTSLRISNLAHILAISGLHMAMTAIFVFWCVSRGLAFLPSLTLRFPPHKWGAAAALFAAVFYMLISSGSTATNRAFIMVLIALFAVLCDRPVISVRNVALAFLAVLTLSPESLLQAGFQMSFAATLALVAVYENRFLQPFVRPKSLWLRALRNVCLFLLTLFITTLVAGGATLFLILHHFQLFPIYGVLANLLAMPIFTFVVMPMVPLSLLFMMFDWECVPLYLLGMGGVLIIDIAAWVSELPNAALHRGAGSPWLLPVFALGLCWLCLWRERWRFLGLAVLVLVFLLALAGGASPDDEARTATLLGADGARP